MHRRGIIAGFLLSCDRYSASLR
ncbi:hypothetical protein MJK72_03210 [Klebsiella pneumoniae]|nr:hypothetical protein MJK72_03210 [Klebsiella pneumoniae]